MSEKEHALQILDEIRNRDGIGYNDYSDLWDANQLSLWRVKNDRIHHQSA